MKKNSSMNAQMHDEACLLLSSCNGSLMWDNTVDGRKYVLKGGLQFGRLIFFFEVFTMWKEIIGRSQETFYKQ